jgi:hypothetical protein
MRSCVTLLRVVAIIAAIGVSSQVVKDERQAAPDVRPLRLSGEVPVVPALPPFRLPIQCNRQGEILLRPQQPGAIVQISSDGKSVTKFELTTVRDLAGKRVFLRDFALDAAGRVYVLAGVAERGVTEIYVFRFGADGRYESSVRIAKDFLPSRIAVVGSLYWVSGAEVGIVRGPAKHFGAFFDRNGNVAYEPVLEDSSSEPAESKGSTARREEWLNTAAMSRVAAGEDGNIYFLRPGTPLTVHVLSTGGEVLREFPVKTPSRHMEALDLKVADGRVAIALAEPVSPLSPGGSFKPDITVALYDAATGDLVGRYATNEETRGMLACYSIKRGFTFFDSSNRQKGPPRIVYAQP